MRERLVSYLLGEMNAEEAERLEAEVASNADLHRQLEHLRQCLPADDEQPPVAMPRGLADRTADSVHDLVLGLESVPAGGEECGGRGYSFTLVDGLVTVGVVLALGMMVLPALQESREVSRRGQCANGLRQLSHALESYAESRGGLFPMVQPGENAGSYTLKLAEGGFASREDLARWVVCPSSPLSSQTSSGRARVRIPKPAELAAADPQVFKAMRRTMGGSYAYRLGYLEGPLYMPIGTQQKSRSPLLADTPHPSDCGRWQSLNHRGRGQNVLFADGSVNYRVNCLLPSADDNFFTNADGRPAAGLRQDDAVLVGSEVTPGVLPTARWVPLKGKVGTLRFRGYLKLPASR